MTYSEALYDQFTPAFIAKLLANTQEAMLNGVELVNFTSGDTSAQFSQTFKVPDALQFISSWYQRFDPITGERKRMGGRIATITP